MPTGVYMDSYVDRVTEDYLNRDGEFSLESEEQFDRHLARLDAFCRNNILDDRSQAPSLRYGAYYGA